MDAITAVYTGVLELHARGTLTEGTLNKLVLQSLSRDNTAELFELLQTNTQWDGRRIGHIGRDYTNFIRLIAWQERLRAAQL